MSIVINIVAFYAGWFGAAMLAARGLGAWAALPCLAVVVLHLALSRGSRAEVALLVAAGAMGLVAEAALLAGGVTRFPGGAVYGVLPPLWLVTLWMAFSTTLNSSLAWLKTRLALAAVLGLAGGPAAYYGGAQLGAMQLGEPLAASLLAIGVVWAVACPLLAGLAWHLNSATAKP